MKGDLPVLIPCREIWGCILLDSPITGSGTMVTPVEPWYNNPSSHRRTLPCFPLSVVATVYADEHVAPYHHGSPEPRLPGPSFGGACGGYGCGGGGGDEQGAAQERLRSPFFFSPLCLPTAVATVCGGRYPHG